MWLELANIPSLTLKRVCKKFLNWFLKIFVCFKICKIIIILPEACKRIANWENTFKRTVSRDTYTFWCIKWNQNWIYFMWVSWWLSNLEVLCHVKGSINTPHKSLLSNQTIFSQCLSHFECRETYSKKSFWVSLSYAAFCQHFAAVSLKRATKSIYRVLLTSFAVFVIT
jgi:hypothetical protein